MAHTAFNEVVKQSEILQASILDELARADDKLVDIEVNQVRRSGTSRTELHKPLAIELEL